jgi:hypothetical protein
VAPMTGPTGYPGMCAAGICNELHEPNVSTISINRVKYRGFLQPEAHRLWRPTSRFASCMPLVFRVFLRPHPQFPHL